MTAQVAHDVRSPLAVIDMTIKKLSNIPKDYRTLILNAMQRMSDIINNLLIQYKNPLVAHPGLIKKELISSIIESIFSEKRSQYSNMDVLFELLIKDNARNSVSCVHENDLKRVLSNLINNAVEALHQKGNIIITLSKINDFLNIEITDNGCGIPSHILPKIIKGGISVGKRNGLGLGVSHAIKCVKQWNGKIDIQSSVNKGTTVNILLPLAE